MFIPYRPNPSFRLCHVTVWQTVPHQSKWIFIAHGPNGPSSYIAQNDACPSSNRYWVFCGQAKCHSNCLKVFNRYLPPTMSNCFCDFFRQICRINQRTAACNFTMSRRNNLTICLDSKFLNAARSVTLLQSGLYYDLYLDNASCVCNKYRRFHRNSSKL